MNSQAVGLFLSLGLTATLAVGGTANKGAIAASSTDTTTTLLPSILASSQIGDIQKSKHGGGEGGEGGEGSKS